MGDGAQLVDRLVPLEQSDPVQYALVNAAMTWALCGLERPVPLTALLVLAQGKAVPQLRAEEGGPVPPGHPEVQAALARAAAPLADCPPLIQQVAGSAEGPDGDDAVVAAAALVEATQDWYVRQESFHRLHRLVTVEELVPVGRRATREGFWYTAETLLEDAVEHRIRDAYVAIAHVYHRQGFDSTADLWMQRMDREAPMSLADLVRAGVLPVAIELGLERQESPLQGVPLSQLRVRPAREDDRR